MSNWKDQPLPHIYGPVQSRRHGVSLGINVGFVEAKVCTWSCLYCQCGFGTLAEPAKAAEKIGIEAADPKEILEQVVTSIHSHPNIQSITFAGNTEPGTYPHLRFLIQDLIELRKVKKGSWKITVLSNGSELENEQVRAALDLVDEVWIKLDVSDDRLFHRLNRPLARIGSLQDHIDRIKLLRNPRIQTMLWTGPDEEFCNYTEENLKGLISIYREISPLAIHVYTIDRDPAFPSLEPISTDQIQKFQKRIQIVLTQDQSVNGPGIRLLAGLRRLVGSVLLQKGPNSS